MQHCAGLAVSVEGPPVCIVNERREAMKEGKWRGRVPSAARSWIAPQDMNLEPLEALALPGPPGRDAGQWPLARPIASERAPTSMRLKAQVASRLNQLRVRNVRPR